jgi:hypothetical protein
MITNSLPWKLFKAQVAAATFFAALASALMAAAAPLPTALTFIGYGQSTMVGPGTNIYQGATCTFSTTSGGQVTISGVSGTPFASAVPGAVIAGNSSAIVAGSNPTITGFVSGTSGGNGVYSVSVSITGGPFTCAIAQETTFSTLLTGSNINSNAFMIGTSPIVGPRGMWETLTPTNNSASKPILLSSWSGFALLKEVFYGDNYDNGNFYTETPMSSFVAQFVAQTGWNAPNVILAENMAHGGEDWVASYPGILAPGNNDWTDFVTAQRFFKTNIQGSGCGSSCPGTGFTGPFNYRLGGVPMRLGESAAAAKIISATASFTTSTSGNTAISTSSVPTLNGVSQPVSGWCAYDFTASAFIGYVASWVSTTLTVGPTSSAVSSSGSADSIYLSPCYPGFLAELRSIVAQFSASDISDAPNPGGVPIFAAMPSSQNFGANQRYFQFAINAAHVTEALADRRMVVTGPSFVGPYQGDTVHGEPQQNAIVGAYQGKWAAWNLTGKRTPPFAMVSAQWIAPGVTCGGQSTNYCVRVTFQMPPSQPCVAPGANGMSCASNVTAAQQQVLQLYSDSNLPSISNSGFCYLDGAYPAGGSSFAMFSSSTGACPSSSSGISISSVALTSGSTNQIDLVTNTSSSATVNGATNPTVTLGAYFTPNGVTIFGVPNAHLFAHNVANKDCTIPGNTALAGKAFKNVVCDGVGTALNYLIDFAAPSFIGVGQTLTTAW